MLKKLQQLFVFVVLLLLVVGIFWRKADLTETIATVLPEVFRVVAPTPLAIETIAPASLVPSGNASVDVVVARNGRPGPIAIEVTNVPNGITVTVHPVQGEESTARIELAASETLGDTALDATATVRASIADNIASQQLFIRVPCVNRPSFPPLDRIILKPGMEETVAVRIQRNGFEGPLSIHAVNPPSGVRVTELTPTEGASESAFHIATEPDAPEGDSPIKFEMSAYGRIVTADLPLVIDSSPYRLRSLRVVRLRPGETTKVDVPIDRDSYFGPVQLNAVGLPDNVVMPEAEAQAEQSSVTLQFQAGMNAIPAIQAATIHAAAGRLTEEGTIVIRITDDTDDGYLPREIVAEDAVGRITAPGSIGSRTSVSGKAYLRTLYGSSPEAQAAVASGLDWLARCQRNDGSWTLSASVDQSNAPDAVLDSNENPVLATALAVLPFLGEGVTHKRSSNIEERLAPYRASVLRGLRFLHGSQATSQDEPNNGIGGESIVQTLVTLALAESYGLSKDEKIKPLVKTAVAALLKLQQDTHGGWREQPAGVEELLPTAWAVMALKTARYARVPVPEKVLERAEKFIDECGVGPASFRQSLYADFPGYQATPPATAAGLFVRQLLGWPKSKVDLTKGRDYIMAHLPPERSDALGDVDYYFFATQVLRNMEGDEYDLWNHLIQRHLVQTQAQEGKFAGSWNPPIASSNPRASRMYVSVLAVLTLQSYQRSLPLYRPVKLRAEERGNDDGAETDDEQNQ
jgi:hypothetical protein